MYGYPASPLSSQQYGYLPIAHLRPPLLTNYPVQLFANQKVTLAEKMADGK